MPRHPAYRQLDWQSFTAGFCRGVSNDEKLRMALQAAVRTTKVDACESLVDLQTLSQSLAALVADIAAIYMHIARLAIVHSWLVCGRASSSVYPRDRCL
eukprot:5474931-Pleurochrysis_carterae.AAC.1